MNESSSPEQTQESPESRAASLRREGNTCIGLGTGVGVLGIGSAVTLGATCPLCFFVAPALLGMGAYGHFKARKMKQHPEEK